MDYYLQQQIDNIRYYANQQKADYDRRKAEVDQRATDEIKNLIQQHYAQVQSEVDQAMRSLGLA